MSCRRRRNGAALVAALVCLTIVVSILGTMLLHALSARRQLHAERDLRQCELLLQAGVDRAIFRHKREADYRGETWSLPAAAIIGAGDGQVTIALARDSGDGPWQVSVVAEYPLGGHQSVRRSRTILLPSKTP
jgi:type II secretory pathway component PulK